MSETRKSMVRDLTGGSVVKQLLIFAFPLFISNSLQAVYNIVDMIVVGQWVGKEGMSAVSIGGDILHLITFLAMGFSSAGQILIAQHVGAKNFDAVRKTIGTLFTVLLSSSVVISVVCFFLRYNILHWLNTPDDAFDYAYHYTVTCVFGLFFIYGYNVVSAILRGMGDSRRPFVFIAIAAILNIILDILFVAVFDMKAFGAALATVIGQGVSFIVSLIYLYRRRENFGFDFRPESFKPDRTALGQLVSLGIPMAIQSAAVMTSKIILTAWINAYGVVYSALGGVYNKVNMVSGIVSNSFTAAGSTMVGQNLGVEKYERVPKILRVVLVCGTAITLVFSAVIIFLPGPVFRAFTGDEDVLKVASILIWPIVVNFFGSATRSVAFSLINGSGNTKLNLTVAIIDGVISRIGIAALLGFALGMDCLGFWYGDAIAGYVPFLVGSCYFLSGRWKTNRSVSVSEQVD